MIKIKVCGMKDPSNVKDIGEAKPDFMGFIFYPRSTRYVGAEPDRSIFNNVPSGITRVGVFVDETVDKILELVLRSGLEMVQLHGNESPEFCSYLRSSGLIITKVFNISESFNFKLTIPYISACDYFLFDTKTEIAGGSGKKFNWYILNKYNLEKPFFLSGGIGPDDTGILKTIENRGLFAADINSCFEISPGIKNVKMVKTFIDGIKNRRL
jgi:phosphoribosylanthranilate isomerase